VSELAPKPLRIALFTGNYDYIKDGVALTLNRLVAYLEKNNIPVLVFAPTAAAPAFKSEGELVSVPSFAIPFRSEYRIATSLSKAARARLVEFKPTLFHIAVPDILGYQALKQAEAWGLPVVATFHTRYDTYLKFYGLGFLEKFAQKYFRKFYARCEKTFPPSQSMADELRSEGIAERLEVFGRGVDSELFNPDRRSLDWRRSRGIGDDEIVVCFVSRLVKEKNTDLMARCFKRVRESGVKFRPLIVGLGPEEQTLRVAIPDGVFVGFKQGEELAKAYASSDIFFFASESETFGNVTLEAMASGLPAIVADATGSRSIVEHGMNGFVQDAHDQTGFDVHLTRLIQDESLRKSMAKASRVRALEFNWDAILAKLVSSFRIISDQGRTLS
jgi:phosphatidylinositol alpha 1,6-mannosyltransferase